MSVSAGFTAEEIREFVLEYQALPQTNHKYVPAP